MPKWAINHGECIETLEKYAAGDHVQKSSGRESQQRKHPQQRQQAGKESRPIAKSGPRPPSTTRMRGQVGVRARGPLGGADREQLQVSRELPEEDQLQGERRGQQRNHKLSYRQPSPSPSICSPTWRTARRGPTSP